MASCPKAAGGGGGTEAAKLKDVCSKYSLALKNAGDWARNAIKLLNISFPGGIPGGAGVDPFPNGVAVKCTSLDDAHSTIHEHFTALQNWTSAVAVFARQKQTSLFQDDATLCTHYIEILDLLLKTLKGLGKDPKLGPYSNEQSLGDARDLCRRYKRSLNRLNRWGNALSHWETLLVCCAHLPQPPTPTEVKEVTRPPWPPWPTYDEDEPD